MIVIDKQGSDPSMCEISLYNEGLEIFIFGLCLVKGVAGVSKPGLRSRA